MKSQFDSLTKFAERIEQIEKTKNDYMATPRDWGMTKERDIKIFDVGTFGLTEHAENQIADHYKIPRKYYEATKQVPGLTAQNVNAWGEQDFDERRLLRTLDGNVRAFLSDKFKPIDNYDVLMESVFPVFEPMMKDIEFKSMALSEKRMYLQFVIKKFEVEVRKGEVISYGGTITNSEVGKGSLNVESWLYYYICDNGMARNNIFKKYHVGRRVSEDDNFHIWKSDTLKAELKGYKLRMRDVLDATFTQENFDLEIAKINGAIRDEVKNPIPVIQNVTKRFGLTDSDGESIMADMVERNSFTRWGVANGITALAHSMENTDRQYKLERIGGELLDIKEAEWKYITEDTIKVA